MFLANYGNISKPMKTLIATTCQYLEQQYSFKNYFKYYKVTSNIH